MEVDSPAKKERTTKNKMGGGSERSHAKERSGRTPLGGQIAVKLECETAIDVENLII